MGLSLDSIVTPTGFLLAVNEEAMSGVGDHKGCPVQETSGKMMVDSPH